MKTLFVALHLGLVFINVGPSYSQVPETQLYLFQLTKDDSSRWHVHSPALISSWNPGGYTNQPEWLDDNTLLVSAKRVAETQNEIYLLDLKASTVRRMTETPESEFSPTITPDGKHFSVIRQVHGDAVDQQVFQFPLDLASPGEPVLPRIQNVGYHCWLNPNDVALFLVGDPIKLGFASIPEGTPRIYSSGIGRCLRKTTHGELAYVHKYSDTFWFLKIMNPDTRTSEIVHETLYGKEDFAIGPTGEYFMGSGSTLYVLDPKAAIKRWVPIFDLAVFGLTNITRLAINKSNAIAIVDDRG